LPLCLDPVKGNHRRLHSLSKSGATVEVTDNTLNSQYLQAYGRLLHVRDVTACANV